MLRTPVAAIVVFSLFSSTASAAPYVWTPIGPEGGYVNALAVDPQQPTTVYASVQYDLFRSTDAASSWQTIDLEHSVYSLAIAPTSPISVVAGSQDSPYGLVYRSHSDGSTFSPPVRVGDDFIMSFAVDPHLPSTIFATVQGSKVALSGDAGQSWTTMAVDFRIKGAIAVGGNRYVYVPSERDGLFRSTDRGATWSQVSDLDAAAIVSDGGSPGILYAGNSEGFYRSTDDGFTWEPLDSGLPPDGVVSIAVDPANSSTLYAGTEHGLFRSLDAGLEWAPTALTTHQITHLAISAAEPTTIYAGLGLVGVARVDDRGAAWQRLSEGLARPFVNVLSDPFDPSTLYAIGSGFFRSGDAGRTWELRVDGLSNLLVRALVVHPTAPGTLYAGTCPHDRPDGPSLPGGVFRSTDAGRHWEATGFPLLEMTDLGAACVTSLAIDHLHPDTLYAVAELHGVFKTTDGANTWSKAEQGIENDYIDQVIVSPHDSQTLYASASFAFGGEDCGLYKSSDGGRQWVPSCVRGVGYTALVIDPAHPGRLFAGFDFWDSFHCEDDRDGVYESTDGGSSWGEQPLLAPCDKIVALAVDPTRPQTLWAATFIYDVFTTNDSGRTWQSRSFGRHDVASFAFQPTGSRTIVYAGTEDGVYEMVAPCPGDCNHDDVVSIAEILLGVGISIEGDDAGACPNLDLDDSGRVEVNELVSAVGEALSGCGPSS